VTECFSGMELLGNQDGQVRHLDMAHVLLGCLQNMAHGFRAFSLAAGVIWACEPLAIKMAGTRSMPAVGCQIITATACFSRMELYNYERQRRVITRTPYVPEPNSGDQLKNTSEPCYVGINGRMLVASSKTIFCHRCHR
jgi:hypothetical protein